MRWSKTVALLFIRSGSYIHSRTYDREEFNSNRRFYRWTNNVAEYLKEIADREPQTEVHSVDEKCIAEQQGCHCEVKSEVNFPSMSDNRP